MISLLKEQIKKIERFYFLIENYLNHVLSLTQPSRRKLATLRYLLYLYKQAFGSCRTIIRLKINDII
jgi:hypothetical protein